MWAVAEAAGPTEIDRGTLAAARRVLFGQGGIADKQLPAAIAPTAFAAAVPPALRDEALRALIVMALVDGSIDAARIDSVSAFAATLGSTDEAVADLVKAAHGRIEEAKADMIRANMASITNAPWSGNTTSDVGAYLLPYQGDKVDPALVARFEALGTLPEATFGWHFWRHFTKNGYAFPGDPKGLNILFSLPHDSCHVLADYDTSAEGEMLTSTFTAAMHPKNSMAAHVLRSSSRGISASRSMTSSMRRGAASSRVRSSKPGSAERLPIRTSSPVIGISGRLPVRTSRTSGPNSASRPGGSGSTPDARTGSADISFHSRGNLRNNLALLHLTPRRDRRRYGLQSHGRPPDMIRASIVVLMERTC